ncbi:hypothetical protein LWI29_027509 [Acer saccharum]|uniref:Uncharacterized protein n=1 Tax=Acer saccharum TaxID=4024 RepID=A0AA39SQE2_ACESA|nr:hypothetical protein LWI29_027509 [Acer saccharum]
MEDFRETVDWCKLSDMGYKGPAFTWCNRWERSDLVQEHLDRRIGIWRNEVSVGGIFTLSLAGRDFQRMVDPWDNSRGSGDFKSVVAVIKNCNSQLSSWNSRNRVNLWAEIQKYQRDFHGVTKNVQLGSWSVNEGIEHKLDSLLLEEEEYWPQRPRVDWLKKGHKNTKYFHLKATMRKAQNEVLELFDSDGKWCEGDKEMEHETKYTTIENCIISQKPANNRSTIEENYVGSLFQITPYKNCLRQDSDSQEDNMAMHLISCR